MIKLSIPPQKHFDHYLFGSVLYSENPSDIDIAIIYDKKIYQLTRRYSLSAQID